MTALLGVLTFLLLVLGFVEAEPVGAQDIARLQAGVVSVISQRSGTGFIVLLESDTAYILTAAHVVAGGPNPKVEFFTKKNVLVQAEVLRGAESDHEMRGLALLMVRGKENLPTEVTVLPLDGTRGFSAGEDIPWRIMGC